jgi:hypothetical protein
MSSDEDSLNNDNYISEEEEVVKPKKRKPKKDPLKPKRNMSAFFLYSNANRARIKQDNEGIAFGQVVSTISLFRYCIGVISAICMVSSASN